MFCFKWFVPDFLFSNYYDYMGIIISNCQLIGWGMSWMTSPANAESLSTIRSLVAQNAYNPFLYLIGFVVFCFYLLGFCDFGSFHSHCLGTVGIFGGLPLSHFVLIWACWLLNVYIWNMTNAHNFGKYVLYWGVVRNLKSITSNTCLFINFQMLYGLVDFKILKFE